MEPLTFAREPFADVLEQCKPHFEAHWQETEMFRAGTAFNPNYERYIAFNKMDYYQFFVARRAGQIVGNAGMYVTEGMHDRRKIAVEDTWFVTATERGMAGVMFLRFVEQDLRAQGVQEVYMTTKLANRSGAVLEVCGYSHVANQYWKNLECAPLTRRRRQTMQPLPNSKQ